MKSEKSALLNKVQRLPIGLLRKYQGKMPMPEEDEILCALQASALDGDHSIIIARKPIAITLFIPGAAGNNSKFHSWNAAFLEKRFPAGKELLDRLVAIKQTEPAV